MRHGSLSARKAYVRLGWLSARRAHAKSIKICILDFITNKYSSFWAITYLNFM